MNIILVTGANARARTITLDWRHWTVGSIGLCTLFLGFTLAFNFATLKWAAAAKPPWLQAIVLAAASGKVVFAGEHPHYGKMVEIDHGNGLVTRYAHASELNVSEGNRVLRGQRVATVGSTGRSTGPHLHCEVRLEGVPQNPARFLHAAG